MSDVPSEIILCILLKEHRLCCVLHCVYVTQNDANVLTLSSNDLLIKVVNIANDKFNAILAIEITRASNLHFCFYTLAK